MQNEKCKMQNDKTEGEDRIRDLKPRTKQFALRIVRMYGALPKRSAASVLGRQALRSGTSVGANYPEANRARSRAEFIAKMGDCLKELEESEYWLELLVESGIVRPSRMDGLLDETPPTNSHFHHHHQQR
jgi:four helix bundle protein